MGPCGRRDKHSSAAGRSPFPVHLHHAEGHQGGGACLVSALPHSSFGSDDYKLIGWICLPMSLIWNARYKSKSIPQPPSNLSEFKAQIYRDSNLQRFIFMRKESCYKFWIFPFLILHLLAANFSGKRQKTQVMFCFSVICILFLGPFI